LTNCIIGISAFYHDSAVALVKDGVVIAAAQEERFSRIKNDSSFPANALKSILFDNGLHLRDIDKIVYYEKPFVTFERLLETYIANAPQGFLSFSKAIPVWLKQKLFLKKLLKDNLRQLDEDFDDAKLAFSEHHLSHAASAYYPSNFEEAVILCLDGVGEYSTSTVALGRGNTIEIDREIHFPHSLGLLYSAFTYYLGFEVNEGEYKVMGLAPYGKPIYKEKIKKHLIDIKPDGSFRLNQSYFNYMTGLTMVNRKFCDLFGSPERNGATEKLSRFHMDIASSIQEVTEEIILLMTKHLATQYQIDNLCLAGGVASNCVANGKVLEAQHFRNIWVQPAAGDAGGAVGAALAAHYHNSPEKRVKAVEHVYLGPSFDNSVIEKELRHANAVFSRLEDPDLITATADFIAQGKIVGWFQGKMEFGPRALGNRSILADPRLLSMQQKLNLKIKFREGFRPFAPAILYEDLNEWFDIDIPSPFMTFVTKIKEAKRIDEAFDKDKTVGFELMRIKRSVIPAVTHVDFSARVQTVNAEQNRLFHDLLTKFKELTSCPVILNTSMNIRGEPIVCTPIDAYKCFLSANLDVLVVGNFMLIRKDQFEFSKSGMPSLS
jgi:carbamoyltransferase